VGATGTRKPLARHLIDPSAAAQSLLNGAR